MQIFSLFLLLFVITNKVLAVELQNFLTYPKEECTVRNGDYFKIIEHFFGSVSLISLYFIHPNEPSASSLDLSNNLLNQIPKSNCIQQYFSNISNNFWFILFRDQLFRNLSSHRHRMWLCKIINQSNEIREYSKE